MHYRVGCHSGHVPCTGESKGRLVQTIDKWVPMQVRADCLYGAHVCKNNAPSDAGALLGDVLIKAWSSCKFADTFWDGGDRPPSPEHVCI